MVLIVAIIGMIIIMVRERNRVLVIETEAPTQWKYSPASHHDSLNLW